MVFNVTTEKKKVYIISLSLTLSYIYMEKNHITFDKCFRKDIFSNKGKFWIDEKL